MAKVYFENIKTGKPGVSKSDKEYQKMVSMFPNIFRRLAAPKSKKVGKEAKEIVKDLTGKDPDNNNGGGDNSGQSGDQNQGGDGSGQNDEPPK